jgi:hypothetical protein
MMKIATTSEKINAQGGLVLVGRLLNKVCKFPELFSAQKAALNQVFKDEGILKIAIGLLCQGRTHFSDVELFRGEESQIMQHGLEINAIPSESSFRQLFNKIAKRTPAMDSLQEANQNLLKSICPSPIKVGEELFIPNDIDVTPLNNEGSHREDIGFTYKGFVGYAPIMSNLGKEGYLLHQELRPGYQHSQKDTPEFLKENFRLLAEHDLEHKVLVRLDSGFDSADTLEVLRESGHRFLIKRNLRGEDKVKWLSHAKAHGEPSETPREGKNVYYGTAEHCIPGGASSTQGPLTCVYKVTQRSIDRDGHGLLIDDLEVDLYWTNLPVSPQEVILQYQDHATSEQFHSEIKSDMGIERLPSKSFLVNELFFMLGAIAYNILRVVDSRVMDCVADWPPYYRRKGEKQSRRRVGSIMRDFILIASKVVKHAGKVVVKFSESWPWTKTLQKIAQA